MHFPPKHFLAICAMITCIITKAQSQAATNVFDPNCHLILETKVGAYHFSKGGFGVNAVLEKEMHQYFAWDIFSIDFSAPFNLDLVSVGIKTGVRGFSPHFWKRKMRAYGSLALGYDCGIITTPILPPTERTGHGFALTSGVGCQYLEHFFLGYDLEYSTAKIDKGKFGIAHYVKFGWRF